MRLALLFPGQGSQIVGMGAAIARESQSAARVLEEIDAALGEKLSSLMREGPAEQLMLTRNAQPALFAASQAVLAALRERVADPLNNVAYVAGHSLGEYSALAAVGSLDIGDGARLLRARGRAMQEAVPAGQGSMAAILGLDSAKLADILAENGYKDDRESGDIAQPVCQIANDNAPGQVVISGHSEPVKAAGDILRQQGARRIVFLEVSAPFHCALMAPVQKIMKAELEQITIKPPRRPVILNVTARPTDDPQMIRDALIDQITATVRWRETMDWIMANNIDACAEIGTGKVLSGLAKRYWKSQIFTSENLVDIEAIASHL